MHVRLQLTEILVLVRSRRHLMSQSFTTGDLLC